VAVRSPAGALIFHKRAGQHFAEPSETPDELTAQLQIGIGSHKDSDTHSKAEARKSEVSSI
jgi:hypothetical protein